MSSDRPESKINQDIVDNPENTMREGISRSVGMALCILSKIYYPPDGIILEEEVDPAYRQCIKEMRENKIDTLDIEKRAEQSINELDKATVFIDDKDQIFVFPLKIVLPLVWGALNDDEKYTQHHEGSEEEKLAAAKADRPKRLESLSLCLQKMRPGICHHGVRNELVFLLNKTYGDFDFIEDESATIMTILREFIDQHFWKQYTKEKNPEKQINLWKAFQQWLMENDASQLFPLIDDKSCLEKIKTFFVKNGSLPTQVEKLARDTLRILPFYCDFKENKLVSMIHSIVEAPPQSRDPNRDRALEQMIEWIQSIANFAVLSNQDKQKIVSFYLMEDIRSCMSRYQFLFSLNGQAEKWQSLQHESTQYFQCFNERPVLESDTMRALPGNISELHQDIAKLKKDSMSSQIENFFAQWFGSEDNAERSKLYSILLNADMQKKILLEDDQIQRIIKENHEEKKEDGEEVVIHITPYEISRVFLHAIMMNPVSWTDIFSSTLNKVLTFVENHFNQSSNQGLSGALQRDSYPEQLIAQLNYLVSVKNAMDEQRDPPQTSPEDMILLPKQIKTFQQWCAISDLLTDEVRKEIYQSHRGLLHKVFSTEINSAGDYKVGALAEIMQSLSQENQIEFIRKLGLGELGLGMKEIIQNAHDLYDVLRVYKENQIAFIRESKLGMKEIIQSGSDLNCTLKAIHKENQIEFIRECKLDMNKIIENVYMLSRVLEALFQENQIAFIREYNLDMNEIIKNAYMLSRVLGALFQENQIAFIRESKLDMNNIIKKRSDLLQILSVIPTSDRMDFIRLIDMQIDLTELKDNTPILLTDPLANIALQSVLSGDDPVAVMRYCISQKQAEQKEEIEEFKLLNDATDLLLPYVKENDGLKMIIRKAYQQFSDALNCGKPTTAHLLSFKEEIKTFKIPPHTETQRLFNNSRSSFNKGLEDALNNAFGILDNNKLPQNANRSI